MSDILTINGGSSSIKFALFSNGDSLKRMFSGSIQRIGLPDAELTINDSRPKQAGKNKHRISNHGDAGKIVIDVLRERGAIDTIGAIGHRIVHGGPNYLDHAKIDAKMLEELQRVSPIDPDHLPGELALIRAFASELPDVVQIACFDTAFHRDLPTVSKTLPIPRKYQELGVRRYGFHGLSFSYLTEELRRIDNSAGERKRVILAHLGNGCSMAAVREGQCIDTTMSFTPTAGLVMGTRTGDLDPGAIIYLMRQEKMSIDQIDQLINKQSGLLGVSGVSSDMRDLLAKREKDANAAEAVDLFCYQARKWIGALAAALGGVDTLVFSGGIGEHAPEVRSRICDSLEYLGLQIDTQRNGSNAGVISADKSKTIIRVIPTDEEIMIARIADRLSR